MKRSTRSAKPLSSTWLPQSALICLTLCAALISAQDISVKSRSQKGDFKLVSDGQTADILVSPDDHKVVQIAADDLASDVERVTGSKPKVVHETRALSASVVIIGTLGKATAVDDLVKSGRLDVSQIRGRRESFVIATVKNPLPNISSALVIIGSDRRGTAFGVYEMSQAIGVSPWYWWADVAPRHKSSLIISQGTRLGGEPSVKYRGIFINDEDWGLQPWAAKTFEPEAGNIGPKTYAKVFELLLRLKANTLWPAMHEVTRPFNADAANRQAADDHAIIMGSSHAEPMLRNNVGEWKARPEEYNFVTDPARVTDYWEQRAKENGRFENIYTLGMRGIHDSPIQGARSQTERIALLEKIFAVQRGLLTKYVSEDVEKIPQIFCPYKEVLTDYRAGLKVPDDVTIVFPDDNFGYIRQFPTAEQRMRKGGFGVYYHISYLGRPLSYLWLNSTPPAFVFEEMSKAYANGMRDLWILNVGDIKPAEIGIEMFMQMAYDAKKWNAANQHQFLQQWAGREFGPKASAEIASIMDKYYRLGFGRKPEHLQWYLPTEPARKSDLSEAETLERLSTYATLRKRADALYDRIESMEKDPLYELVVYPVRSAAMANERFFAAELARSYKARNRSGALNMAKRSLVADAEIQKETRYFNETLKGGKWRHIMSPEMGPGQWPSMRSTPPALSLSDFQETAAPDRTAAATIAGAGTQSPVKSFSEVNGVVSIEAEHFRNKQDHDGFAWSILDGLGKTGDSVTVFPNAATTFNDLANRSPNLEYPVFIRDASDFDVYFYLLPTQPLVTGNGLRVAFSVDGGEIRVVTIDKETEVSSAKWARNVLNETTVGSGRIHLNKGRHILRLYAVDTGVVVDKIVMTAKPLPTTYFGPSETSGSRGRQ